MHENVNRARGYQHFHSEIGDGGRERERGGGDGEGEREVDRLIQQTETTQLNS